MINNGTQDLIHVLMLDTVLLCGNTASDFGLFGSQYETRYNDTISNYYFENIEKKLKQISNTPVPYIIVAGHYPVWSIGIHGPSECLVQKLRPLLHKYRVSNSREFFKVSLGEVQLLFDLIDGESNENQHVK